MYASMYVKSLCLQMCIDKSLEVQGDMERTLSSFLTLYTFNTLADMEYANLKFDHAHTGESTCLFMLHCTFKGGHKGLL